MTAAEAVRLGASGFDAWIEDQVYTTKKSRASMHRKVTGRMWWTTQPIIGWMRKHQFAVWMIAPFVLVIVMAWKVSTR